MIDLSGTLRVETRRKGKVHILKCASSSCMRDVRVAPRKTAQHSGFCKSCSKVARARRRVAGKRFTRLLATSDFRTRVQRKGTYALTECKCLCDCGNEIWVTTRSLVTGNTKSCGCLVRDTMRVNQRLAKRRIKHGLSAHPLYRVHKAMIQRCYNPKNKAYRFYGAKGVTVHEPWKELATFIREIEAEIGVHPGSGWHFHHGNLRGYEPGNVKWLPATENLATENKRAYELERENERLKQLLTTNGIAA